MDKILQIILIITTILFAIFIIRKTRVKKLNYKLTILWLVFSVFIIILAIFPHLIVDFSKVLHIAEPVNSLFLIFIFLLIITCFFISIELSKAQEKIFLLIQEHALLTKKIENIRGGENHEKRK